MTNCPDEIKTLLSKLVDGEITPDERARVDEHVAACAPCRELLDLFRKNETLMANALTSEAFGNAVIESVVRTIRQEGPLEADPVEDGPFEWLRSRPWIPAAAAALLLVGLGALVLHQSSQVAGLKKAVEASRAAQDDVLRATAGNQRQYESMLRELRTEIATSRARQGDIFGGFEPERGLFVQAGFDPREFRHFELWRRGDKEAEFQKVQDRLARPEYTDGAVQPGQAYWYKFRAARADGQAVESTPIRMQAPAVDELSAEQSVKVHCFDLAASGDSGIFLLERFADGKPVVEKFLVRVGDAIGGPVEVAGLGRVDFSTGLKLGRIEEAHQTMPLAYAEPVLDDQNRPIIQKLQDGRAVPLTRQHEVPLSIRANLRATLRSDGGGEKPLFKGSWLRVKAR